MPLPVGQNCAETRTDKYSNRTASPPPPRGYPQPEATSPSPLHPVHPAPCKPRGGWSPDSTTHSASGPTPQRLRATWLARLTRQARSAVAGAWAASLFACSLCRGYPFLPPGARAAVKTLARQRTGCTIKCALLCLKKKNQVRIITTGLRVRGGG